MMKKTAGLSFGQMNFRFFVRFINRFRKIVRLLEANAGAILFERRFGVINSRIMDARRLNGDARKPARLYKKPADFAEPTPAFLFDSRSIHVFFSLRAEAGL
jgi:hypothetical protein